MQSRSKVIAIGVAIAFGLFVAALAFGVSIARLGNLPSGPPPPTTEHVEVIVNGMVSVAANSYESRQFAVPVDAVRPIVRGNFFVDSAQVATIHVMILNSESFANWQSNKTISVNYYSSTQVTTAELEAGVPKGQTLYLIFDNTYDAKAKSVKADIELAYLR